MPQHIFFSWQSDTPNGVGRSFVEACLRAAIGELAADAEIDLPDREIKIDRDTLDEPGSPPITDTIFEKIDRASAFIADMTYVATRLDGGRSPNPNVLVEHGWALKSLTRRKVVGVMNTAYGNPEEHPLPFDLRHVRWPIRFALPDGSDGEERRAAKDGLVKALKDALKAILGDAAGKAGSVTPAPIEPHPYDVRLLRRFRKLIPTDARLFLREHNFGASLHKAKLEPFYDFWTKWKGAEFEFHDTQVQKAFVELVHRNADFSELANQSLHFFGTLQNALTIKTDLDRSQGTQASTVAVATALNERASALSNAIDKFDRLARDRIREADQEEAVDVDQRDAAEAAIRELVMDGNRGAYPEIVPRPRLAVRVAPLAATMGQSISVRTAASVQEQFRSHADEPVKEDADGTQWWMCARPTPKANLNPETSWRMRLVRPGNFEFQVNIGQKVDDDSQIIVDGVDLEKTIIRNLERMFRFACELGFDGGAVIAMAFDGMENVEFRQGRRQFGRSDIYFPTILIGDMSENVASALREQLDTLWVMAGVKGGSPSFKDGIWGA